MSELGLIGLPALAPLQAHSLASALRAALRLLGVGREVLGAPAASEDVAPPDEMAVQQWELALRGAEDWIEGLIRLAGGVGGEA